MHESRALPKVEEEIGSKLVASKKCATSGENNHDRRDDKVLCSSLIIGLGM